MNQMTPLLNPNAGPAPIPSEAHLSKRLSGLRSPCRAKTKTWRGPRLNSGGQLTLPQHKGLSLWWPRLHAQYVFAVCRGSTCRVVYTVVRKLNSQSCSGLESKERGAIRVLKNLSYQAKKFEPCSRALGHRGIAMPLWPVCVFKISSPLCIVLHRALVTRLPGTTFAGPCDQYRRQSQTGKAWQKPETPP